MSTKYGELTRFVKKLEKKLSKQAYREFLADTTNTMAAEFQAKVQKATPFDEGNLRRNWFTTAAQVEGTTCRAEIKNDTHYAEYVEYGHRQEVGRYVPAIGKRLVNAWVEGQFFMTNTAEEFQQAMPAMVERMVDDFMEGLNNGK